MQSRLSIFALVICLYGIILPVNLQAKEEPDTIKYAIKVIPLNGLRRPIKTWQESMAYAMKSSEKEMSEVLDTTDFIQCIGYRYKGIIQTEEEKQKIYKTMLSDSALTVKEITPYQYQLVKMKESVLNRELLDKQLSEILKVGSEWIEIDWKWQGKIYHSTAIIHDDSVCDGIACFKLTPSSLFFPAELRDSLDIDAVPHVIWMVRGRSKKSEIQYNGYEYKGKIKDEAERNDFIERYISDFKEGDFNFRSKLKRLVASVVRVGTKLVEICWNNQNESTLRYSIGIVSEEDLDELAGKLLNEQTL